MSRCKACDTLFKESNFIRPDTNTEEDLCSYCRYVSTSPFFYEEREYQFQSLTEIPVYIENYNNTVDK